MYKLQKASKIKFTSGLSLKVVTCNTCCGRVCLIFLWCYRWICLLLLEFAHKVTSLLQLWRTRLQVTQNSMTTLYLIDIFSQINACKLKNLTVLMLDKNLSCSEAWRRHLWSLVQLDYILVGRKTLCTLVALNWWQIFLQTKQKIAYYVSLS